jgi:hypothetical protein
MGKKDEKIKKIKKVKGSRKIEKDWTRDLKIENDVHVEQKSDSGRCHEHHERKRIEVSGLISSRLRQLVRNDVIVDDLTGDNTVFMGQPAILSGGMTTDIIAQTNTDKPTNPGTVLIVPVDGLYEVNWTATLRPIVGDLDQDPPEPADSQNVYLGASYRTVSPILTEWLQVPGAQIADSIGGVTPPDTEPVFTIGGIGMVHLRKGDQVALQNLTYVTGTPVVRKNVLLSPNGFTNVIGSGKVHPDVAALRVRLVNETHAVGASVF